MSGEFTPLPNDAWTGWHARTLLARCQFGVTAAEVSASYKAGLASEIERLTEEQPESAEFQRVDETLRRTAIATDSPQDLKLWWLHRLAKSANSLREKLTLGWHNHFATSIEKVRSVRAMSTQNDLFRREAWGDFPTLMQSVARDPAMLIWLDGSLNRRRHPNENFAREIMELFCLGVGNYTEADIQEAARAFTGWRLKDDAFWFDELQHDPGEKSIFGSRGQFRGDDVVRLCLERPACPRFLATKLMKWLATDQPDARDVEQLAGRLAFHRLQVRPALREWLGSQEFFAACREKTLIKSPLDFVLGSLRWASGGVKWPAAANLLADLGQDVFAPPSVKGWDGGRTWITSTSMLLRANFIVDLFSSDAYLHQRLDAERLASDALIAARDANLATATGRAASLAAVFWSSPAPNGTALNDGSPAPWLMLAPEYQLT